MMLILYHADCEGHKDLEQIAAKFLRAARLAAERQAQDARDSMRVARSKSFRVMPPASWVVSVKVTLS